MSYQYQYLSTGHRPFVIISFTIWIISIISWSKKKVEYVYLPLGPTYILLVPSEELVPVGFGYWNCLDDDIHRKSFQAFLNKVGKPTFIVYFPFLAQTRLEERSTDWLRFAPVSGCNKKSLVLWNSGNLWHSLLWLSYRSLLLWYVPPLGNLMSHKIWWKKNTEKIKCCSAGTRWARSWFWKCEQWCVEAVAFFYDGLWLMTFPIFPSLAGRAKLLTATLLCAATVYCNGGFVCEGTQM